MDWRKAQTLPGQRWPQREGQVPPECSPLGQLYLSKHTWPLPISGALSFLPSHYSGPSRQGWAPGWAGDRSEVPPFLPWQLQDWCLDGPWSLGYWGKMSPSWHVAIVLPNQGNSRGQRRAPGRAGAEARLAGLPRAGPGALWEEGPRGCEGAAPARRRKA